MSGWTELADKLERAEAEILALTAEFEAMEEAMEGKLTEGELAEDHEYWRAHGAIANIAESFTGRWT